MKQIRIETIRIKRVPDEDAQRDSHLAIGIYVEAQVSYALNGPGCVGQGTRRLEWLKSGGLWGIDEDSKESYLKEVEREELADLKFHLQAFNVDVSDFEEKIEDRDVS